MLTLKRFWNRAENNNFFGKIAPLVGNIVEADLVADKFNRLHIDLILVKLIGCY